MHTHHTYSIKESLLMFRALFVVALGFGALFSYQLDVVPAAYAAEANMSSEQEAQQAKKKKYKYTVQRPKNHVIRVLLDEIPDGATFTANGRYVVETYDHDRLKVLKKGKQAKLRYENGEYILNYGKDFQREKRSTKPLKVTPVKRKKLVEIVGWANPNAWEETDNLFYQSIKIEQSPRADVPVLVNELGIERYTEGLCESGGQERTAYLRALIVAARTYATYHSVHKGKYPGEPYDIDATARSQIFCGAEFTLRTPQVREARKATKKHLVFYNNEIVITPYFSNSDGRTRSWASVWGGTGYDYLVPVDDPCCTHMTMTTGNHGVGMSGEGARYWSDRGKGWKWILKYYYTGVDVRAYKKSDFAE